MPIQTKKTDKFNKQQKKYTSTLKTGTCKFPFDYGGKTYTECHPGTETRKGKWCATSLEKGKKTLKTWAFCKEPSVPLSMPNPKSTFDSNTTKGNNNTSVNSRALAQDNKAAEFMARVHQENADLEAAKENSNTISITRRSL